MKLKLFRRFTINDLKYFFSRYVLPAVLGFVCLYCGFYLAALIGVKVQMILIPKSIPSPFPNPVFLQRPDSLIYFGAIGLWGCLLFGLMSASICWVCWTLGNLISNGVVKLFKHD